MSSTAQPVLPGFLSLIGGIPTYVPYSNTNPMPVTMTEAGSAVAPVAGSAVESSHVLAAAPCTVYGFSVSTGAASGWVLLYNRTTAPANGAVTPVAWWEVPANNTLSVTCSPALGMTVGAVLAFSTTGPFTQTLSATASFSAIQVQ